MKTYATLVLLVTLVIVYLSAPLVLGIILLAPFLQPTLDFIQLSISKMLGWE